MPSRLLPVAVAAVVAVLAGLAAILASDAVTADAKRLVSDSAFVVGALLALLSCLAAVRRTRGRLRRAWAFFAVTAGAWTFGNVWWFYYQIMAPTQPYPSMADVGYVAALPAALAALVLFPAPALRAGDRLRLVLDAVIIVGSLLFVNWHLVIEHLPFGEAPPLLLAVLVTYPVADILLATLALLLLARARDGLKIDLLLVGAAFVVYAVADTAYAVQGVYGTFAIGSLLDLGWVGGYLLLALAGLASARSHGREEPKGSGSALPAMSSMVVYLPLFLGVVVEGGSNYEAERAPQLALGVVVLLLFGIRQAVLTVDNAALRRSLEQRVAERTADLERLGRQNALILDSVAEGIYGVDTNGRVTFANPAAGALLGFEPDALIGKDAHATLHRPEGPLERCSVYAVLRDGASVRRSEEEYVRSDGSIFPAEVVASQTIEGSAVSGAVVAFSDITARREMERLKDEFISVVSHELRTPLTSIRGSLGLIDGGVLGELPPQAARMVRIALDNSERLTRLINDILDIERIQSGAVPMQVTRIEARRVVEQTVESVRAVAQDAGARIETECDETHVLADPDRLTQCLTNLLGNALKFSPAGSGVTVAAHRSGDMVTFVVADEGRGIPADQLEEVFERFRQVDSSDSREKGGTGLGLAITRSIVERHGGSIVAENRPGGGALFRFTIPAAEAASRPVRPVSVPSPAGGPRVLVCDDDEDLLEVLQAVLEERGYAVTPVSRGEDAVDRAIVEQPAVVLLDLRMPGMTGWETIAALRSRPETRHIPVVVLSVLAPVADPALASRADGWVTKPVDPESIERVLAKVTGAGASRRPLVLVVEDDADLASVLVEVLENNGMRAVHVASEQAAIDSCRQVVPDALVLDLQLPDGNGDGVVQALRRNGHLADLPLVVYTAHDMDDEARQRIRLGETVFMSKGRDTPQDLERRLAMLIDKVAEPREREVIGATPAPARR